MVTYELFGLPLVLDLNRRFATFVDDLEREVLHVRLNLCIIELAPDEPLGVEDGVVGVHGDLVLGSVTNQSLTLAEGDIGGGGTVTLVVGNNFNTVILPDTDTTVEEKMSVKSDRTDRIQSTYE